MNTLMPAWVIEKKREGRPLTDAEIEGFIEGSLSGAVTDYQTTAFLMATYFKGMTFEETAALTRAMLESGERYDLSSIPGMKVDKHSTGGVGDKVSIILTPLAAACGLKVPMMAGRGLGHTGGTLDKLESIRGFKTRLSKADFVRVLTECGCVIGGQTDEIAPADKKLYALRDVTATVECIPLIVASILSKKLAEGAEALVLDVKTGNGAFMKTKERARALAKALLGVAKHMKLPCKAIITDMSQPLGYAAGNSIEVWESIEVLRNQKISPFSQLGSVDLREVTIRLCAQMLEAGKVVRNSAAGRKLAQDRLADGSAWEIFRKMTIAQGGDVSQIDHPEKLPISSRRWVFKAHKRGYITQMDTEALGKLIVDMGGGRKKTTDIVDPSVGIVFHKKLGAKLSVQDEIATLFLPESAKTDAEARWKTWLTQAVTISAARKPVPRVIVEELG